MTSARRSEGPNFTPVGATGSDWEVLQNIQCRIFGDFLGEMLTEVPEATEISRTRFKYRQTQIPIWEVRMLALMFNG